MECVDYSADGIPELGRSALRLGLDASSALWPSLRRCRSRMRSTANGGKPIIRGMRISVELILSLLAQGETEDAILADYPDLARGDLLRACLAYAHAVIAQDSLYASQLR